LVQHAVQEAGAYKDRGPLAHKLTDIFLGHPDMALVLMDPRWPLQIPPPLATPNSPRQDRSDYDGSGVMARRAAASLSR
jgi:hypothetical protein